MITELYDIALDLVLRVIYDRKGVHLHFFTKEGLKELLLDTYDLEVLISKLQDVLNKIDEGDYTDE